MRMLGFVFFSLLSLSACADMSGGYTCSSPSMYKNIKIDYLGKLILVEITDTSGGVHSGPVSKFLSADGTIKLTLPPHPNLIEISPVGSVSITGYPCTKN